MPRNPRARGWLFTINNWTQEEYDAVADHLRTAKYGILGKECGAQGTPHIQGYVNYPNPRTWTALKRAAPRARIQRADGSPSQNKTYCSKEGDFWESGDCPEGGVGDLKAARKRRNELILGGSLRELVEEGEIALSMVPVLKKAKLILEQEGDAVQTDACRGIWVYGPPGTGKSHYARSLYGGSLYVKAQNKWFDGYRGEDNILLDDLDSKHLGHYLKIWLDKWSCTGEVKGGTVNLKHKKFIITSNYTPVQLFDDPVLAEAISRRCEFVEKLEVYEQQ